MASTDHHEIEFHDTRRIELLRKLHDTLPATGSIGWACLWLGDIERLERLLNFDSSDLKLLLAGVENVRVVQKWNQRVREGSTASTPRRRATPVQQSPVPLSPVQPSPTQQSPASSRGHKRDSSGQVRKKAARELCIQRDKVCVIEKSALSQAAHIYPFSMRNDKDTNQASATFWDTLRCFWTDERVKTWYNAIFQSSAGTEVCQNLICLSPNAHAYWGKAYFALKPISMTDDKKSLDVQFYWLVSNTLVEAVDTQKKPSLPLQGSHQGPHGILLTNIITGEKIKSGDMITLTTNDPESQPLPDFNLLEMQWMLHRLTAISGAAEAQDSILDDDYDSDGLASGYQWDQYEEDNDWEMGEEEEPVINFEDSTKRCKCTEQSASQRNTSFLLAC